MEFTGWYVRVYGNIESNFFCGDYYWQRAEPESRGCVVPWNLGTGPWNAVAVAVC